MHCTTIKPSIVLTMDVQLGKTQVAGFLQFGAEAEDLVPSFSCVVDDATLMRRLPEWLTVLRAEAALGVSAEARRKRHLAL